MEQPSFCLLIEPRHLAAGGDAEGLQVDRAARPEGALQQASGLGGALPRAPAALEQRGRQRREVHLEADGALVGPAAAHACRRASSSACMEEGRHALQGRSTSACACMAARVALRQVGLSTCPGRAPPAWL